MSRFQDYLRQRQATPPGSPLAEAAIALGVPVFPCAEDKRPLTAHGFKDATVDPARIRAMFADPRAVLIGVPTGRTSGWAVVDVDVKNGAEGQKWLDANSDRLPPTRTHVTRSGGWHLVFRMPATDLRNSAGRIAPGVDVRAEGGYVIVPPSPGYQSVPPHEEPMDMPEWLIEAAMPPRSMPSPVSPPRQYIPDSYAAAALDGECRAVTQAREGTRNHILNIAAVKLGSLVGAGLLTRSTVESELTAAARAAGLPAPEIAKTLRSGLDAGMRRPRQVSPREAPISEPHPAAEFLAKIHAREGKRIIAPIPVTSELMDVPGALRLFVEYCNETAVSPQPFLALAAGICLVGALAGRKYRTNTDLRTNIYAVGIADSGGGKDHARKIAKKVLGAANLTAYLGGEDIASGAAIYTALARHPAILFQIDEFGDWLSEVLGPKAPTHKKQLGHRFKSLYSSANTFLSGTEYADQSRTGRPREDIQQPHACLFGTTTEGQFWRAIGENSLHDGLVARMLIFLSPCSFPDYRDPSLAPVPEPLIEALQAIAAGAADPQTGEVGNLGALMLSTTAPEPYIVPQTAAADLAWHDLRQHQLASQRRAEGTYVTAIAGRLAENAMKLALVRAISRNPAQPVIDAPDVAWGRALAQHCVDTLLREAPTHIANTEFEGKMNKALALIRQHGPITSSALIAKGFRLPERERAEVLRALVDSGMVQEHHIRHDGPGRPTVRYTASGLGIAGGSEEIG